MLGFSSVEDDAHLGPIFSGRGRRGEPNSARNISLCTR